MKTPRSPHLKFPPNRTDEQLPEAARYVLVIFLSGAALWMLLTLRMVISPPSNAVLCGDEGRNVLSVVHGICMAHNRPLRLVHFCFDIFSARLPDRALNYAQDCLVA